MYRFRLHMIGVGVLYVVTAACSSASLPLGPSAAPSTSASSIGSGAGGATLAARSEQPPFDLEAILRGDGFGLVKFRQAKDSTESIIDLDVWVRDLSPNTSYSLQRATDTTLDDACTGTNWLTLGQGPVPRSIVTSEDGTGRASLWRDLSALSPGTQFDIHFRVVQTGTTLVALQSECYRFVVRD